jgi:hypothetical protein
LLAAVVAALRARLVSKMPLAAVLVAFYITLRCRFLLVRTQLLLVLVALVGL